MDGRRAGRPASAALRADRAPTPQVAKPRAGLSSDQQIVNPASHLVTLVYLSVANVFGLLRLLPVSDRDKDAEILVLRHQITVLERQLGTTRPWFSRSDRAFLAALLHRLPRDVVGRFRLLVRPETVLRWHRDLLARRHAAGSRTGRPGRPRTVRSIRLLVLRLARENPSWGTGASMGNCSASASRSPPPRYGRSSAKPGSTRRPTGIHDMGQFPPLPG
jgi:hypothetical protein